MTSSSRPVSDISRPFTWRASLTDVGSKIEFVRPQKQKKVVAAHYFVLMHWTLRLTFGSIKTFEMRFCAVLAEGMEKLRFERVVD